MVIWPLFGTTNQLLAALTLSIISIMLIRAGRNPVYTLVPLAFVLVMSVYALAVQAVQFFDQQNWLLFGMDVVIFVAALWVTVEAVQAMNRERRRAEPDPVVGDVPEAEPVGTAGGRQP